MTSRYGEQWRQLQSRRQHQMQFDRKHWEPKVSMRNLDFNKQWYKGHATPHGNLKSALTRSLSKKKPTLPKLAFMEPGDETDR